MFATYVFQEGTVITPTELAMLQRVFHRLCIHKNLPINGPRAEAEAAYLVALFSDGLNTDDLLWQAATENSSDAAHQGGIAATPDTAAAPKKEERFR